MSSTSKFADLDARLWAEVPERIDGLVEKCAAPAWDIRSKVGGIYTQNDVGYYWNPSCQQAAFHFRPVLDVVEASWCKAALDRAVGIDHVRNEILSEEDVSGGQWVKVAYSPALVRLGQLLNFFPAKDIPWSKPSPLASMLTSGLMGAGLGYGLGWAGEKIMPEKWHKSGRTRKSLALLGAMMGAAPGAAWGLTNAMTDLPLNSPELLKDNTKAPPTYGRVDLSMLREKASSDFVKKAFGLNQKRFGTGAMGPEPVNLNRLGQVLWDVGAGPQTAAATMSSVYAAQQLPGGIGPGYVTPHQTGLLGTMMGAAGGGVKGYTVGWGVGKGLGILTGMPQATQNSLNRSGAMLGVINALVPRLFR